MYETRTVHGVILVTNTSLKCAKADAVDYQRKYGTHCDVLLVKHVWSTTREEPVEGHDE